MPNITVTVSEQTYRRARVRAAELSTSVSALVARSLDEFASGGTETEARKRRFEAQSYGGVRVRNPFRQTSARKT